MSKQFISLYIVKCIGVTGNAVIPGGEANCLLFLAKPDVAVIDGQHDVRVVVNKSRAGGGHHLAYIDAEQWVIQQGRQGQFELAQTAIFIEACKR